MKRLRKGEYDLVQHFVDRLLIRTQAGRLTIVGQNGKPSVMHFSLGLKRRAMVASHREISLPMGYRDFEPASWNGRLTADHHSTEVSPGCLNLH